MHRHRHIPLRRLLQPRHGPCAIHLFRRGIPAVYPHDRYEFGYSNYLVL
jgi:hypothetical protein